MLFEARADKDMPDAVGKNSLSDCRREWRFSSAVPAGRCAEGSTAAATQVKQDGSFSKRCTQIQSSRFGTEVQE